MTPRAMTARERMARALWIAEAVRVGVRRDPAGWTDQSSETHARWLHTADAALAVARELVKEAVPARLHHPHISPSDTQFVINAARAAALRALGETE